MSLPVNPLPYCHIRSAPRRLAFHSLKEVKALFKILNVNMNNEIPVLDALDKCSSEVAKLSASMMPLPGQTFFLFKVKKFRIDL